MEIGSCQGCECSFLTIGLIEHSRRWGDSESTLAVYYQLQLTLSTEVTQCVNDLIQSQMRQEVGHVLDPTARLVNYDAEDAIDKGVLGFHGRCLSAAFQRAQKNAPHRTEHRRIERPLLFKSDQVVFDDEI